MAAVDCVVIGAGIVGLATANELARLAPGLRIAVLEKERAIAAHQTGRNSGVIHAGIYYKPDSKKATTCVRGRARLEQLCEEEGVPFERCGKVVVAVDETEVPALRELARRAHMNGIRVSEISPAELRQIEPHANGVAALHVPSTAIVDYKVVAAKLAARLKAKGHLVCTGSPLVKIEEQGKTARLTTASGERWDVSFFVNCGGLQSDRIARMCGLAKDLIICPFRGEYYAVRHSARGLCRNLIYPVPDPRYPFLGVHFTRSVHGTVECGPNAVLALGREAYDARAVRRDLVQLAHFGGFWRFGAKHWRRGLSEAWRSWSKSAFVRSAQRLVPALRAEHLVRGPVGIRAQALRRDGSLVDDFVIEQSQRGVHVLNAPSPAATASLLLGEHIGSVAQAFI